MNLSSTQRIELFTASFVGGKSTASMISEGSPTNTQFTEHPFPSILGFIEIFYSLWKYYYDFTEYFNFVGETPYNQCSNDRLDFIECRKIKTKLITTANQRKRKRTQSKLF